MEYQDFDLPKIGMFLFSGKVHLKRLNKAGERLYGVLDGVHIFNTPQTLESYPLYSSH